MKKILALFLILFFIAGITSADHRSVIARKNVVSGTVYLSEDFELWSDLTGFDAKDENPANQMLFDTGSSLSGINSIRFDAQDGSGGTDGSLNFAQTEFFFSKQIHIVSAGTSPTDNDVIIVGLASTGSSSQGVAMVLVYDVDHVEYNVFYRDDAEGVGYVIGAVDAGPTISQDADHTLYLFYKGGTGADGEVWAALDGAAWTKVTGLDLNTKAAGISRVATSLISWTGSHASGEWDYYVDNLWAGDTDPK